MVSTLELLENTGFEQRAITPGWPYSTLELAPLWLSSRAWTAVRIHVVPDTVHAILCTVVIFRTCRGAVTAACAHFWVAWVRLLGQTGLCQYLCLNLIYADV